ncbi:MULTISPECIES: TetR/AcrR family transcriptional regulator [Dactylosporangium]|uniref:TetR/AcrR family transcriptional regulator n=1 Tax=Dactylosporangium vinaceum TaxID=53362 RepID=A0ABV5MJA6_9ACTN|nr:MULTISPECIES: TetR/AcrR family transcriptional regulator [Dactylosporangium]
MVRSNTRDEILAAAARLFAASGYKGTSLHDIAVDVGCSKAALLYHFSSKEAILTELCAPAIADLEQLFGRLQTLAGERARAAAIEGFVDLSMRYRKEIQIIYGDLPSLLQQPALQNVHQMTIRICEILVGSDDSVATMIAAKLVLAGIPAIAFGIDYEDSRYSDEELRAALIEAANRALAPLSETR